MATSSLSVQVQSFFLFSTLVFLSFSSLSSSQPTSFRPKALVLPITKDASTLQYLTQIKQRTPLVPIDVVVDLGGQFLWVDCEQGYVSSTYKLPRCGSAQCSLASKSPGCTTNTCILFPDNTVTQTGTAGELAYDVLSVQSTDGSNPGASVTVKQFIFNCAPTFLLGGLAKGVKGMAGFGREKVGLPSQFSAAFSFPRKFAMCLSSGKGVMFFGDGPYVLQPEKEISGSLQYTTLLINPVSTAGAFSQGEKSVEYFIGVKSIRIDENEVRVNKSLLSITTDGVGGTKISTVNPYTVLETSIYKAVVDAFTKEAATRNISRVVAIAPFGTCFSRKNVLSTRLGYAVPTIELVLQNDKTIWRIFGANSMVQVNNNVLCLGFVDGGANPRTSIVLGGYQLEDNLLQFDIARSRLGFSSLLFGRQTTCSNFDFTTKA